MNTILEYIQTVNAVSGVQKILLDMLIKGTILLLAAGGACLLLRKATAALRSIIWSLTMISLLLLPVLSGILPHWQARILPAGRAETAVYENKTRADSAHAAVTAPLHSAEPGILPEYFSSPVTEQTPIQTQLAPVSAEVPVKNHSYILSTVQALSSVTVQNWIGIIWGAGAICVLLPAVSGLIWIGFHSRRGTRIVTGRMVDIMQKTIKTLHIRRTVLLLQWNGRRKLTMPTTWGIMRPVIVMPCDAESWPEARIQVAIMHELAHIQRMDWPAQILARVACAMYWFNPLVWFASRTMRMECERSCDDAVLQAGHTGTEYAEHLLDIVKSMCVKRHTAMVTVPMARVSTIEGRIRAILDGTRKRWSLTRWAVLGTAGVALSALIPFAALQASARTLRTVRETVSVTDIGTNTTVVVSNTVISTTILAAETPGITNEVVDVEEEVTVTQAAETRSLSFAASGRITRVKPPGTVVTNGEILAQLDSGNNWLAVEAGRIGVVHSAEVFSRAEQKYTAFKNMVKENLITTQELNKAEIEYITAKFELRNAQNELDKAELHLEACFLRAPAEGTILTVYTHPGTIIQPKTPVLRLSCNQTKEIQKNKKSDRRLVIGNKVTTSHNERSWLPEPPLLSNFVRLVVGPETMTFEGKEVSWDALAVALEKITARPNTVLEFAQLNSANPDMIAFGKTISMAQKYNFNHVSDVGEKPLGSKGTVRSTGVYEAGRIIPIALVAGMTEADGIVTMRSITFTFGENGTVKAVIDYNLLSGPKGRWCIALSLLDDEGNELVNDQTAIENSGIILGVPFSEEKKAIFYFGENEKNRKITQFRVSISQEVLPPKQVMIAARLIVMAGEKETVVSQPTLVVHTDKEAEVFIGSQEPVPGKLVDTGMKIKILPSIQNGILVVGGKVIFAELAGISSNSINKNTSLTWHSVKENITEFEVKVTDQSKQYSIGPIPYKGDETLIIQLNAKVMESEAERMQSVSSHKIKEIIKTAQIKVDREDTATKGSGTIITEPRTLGLCRGIKSSIAANIHIRKHEEPSLSLTGDDNILPLIHTEIKDKTLVVSADKSFSTQEGITIDVFLPVIEVIEIGGSGETKAEGLKEQKLRIKQMGSGNISGSGTIDFLGIDNQGSGAVNFKEVSSSDCGIRLTGSGNVTVTVTNSLYAKVAGSGNIEYFGTPTVITSDVTGSGTIKGKAAEVIGRGNQSRVKIRKR